jgi:hypothetical protein
MCESPELLATDPDTSVGWRAEIRGGALVFRWKCEAPHGERLRSGVAERSNHGKIQCEKRALNARNAKPPLPG